MHSGQGLTNDKLSVQLPGTTIKRSWATKSESGCPVDNQSFQIYALKQYIFPRFVHLFFTLQTVFSPIIILGQPVFRLGK